jgi:threonine dehydrogenase-like Zn-dependent dehydrogenase
MLALSVMPLHAASASLQTVPEPLPTEGAVLARTLAVGICGTDREILDGKYGWAAHERTRLVLGHESLAEVEDAPCDCGLMPGDLIVGIVRHPDPVPCAACAADEWDMCSNGQYTEHGIKELDGFCRERFRIEPKFAVRVDLKLRETAVLLEPASVVAKAWDHIERIGRRSESWRPRKVLVTGAGPVGLLAALMARQRSCELHVYDRDRGGTKSDLIQRLGGTYHSESIDEVCELSPDVTLECTGAAEVIARVIGHNAPGGIVCFAGLSSGSHRLWFDFQGLNRSMVLQNDVVFGTVNANRRHYQLAADALVKADPQWLRSLISRRVALADWREAVTRQPDDIKVVIDFTLNRSESPDAQSH